MEITDQNDDATNEIAAQNKPLIPAHTRQAAKAIFTLLFFSFLMFTLPFVAFYGTRHYLETTFAIEGFTATAWAVVSSVLCVNFIIAGFAFIAYHDQEYDDEGNPISSQIQTEPERIKED